MISGAEIAALHDICPNAKLAEENNQEFIYLPELNVTVGNSVRILQGLLCPSNHSGYSTRLFLSEQISERPNIGSQPANWTTHNILTKTWYSWSWQGVSETLPLQQMLLSHLGALR